MDKVLIVADQEEERALACRLLEYSLSDLLIRDLCDPGGITRILSRDVFSACVITLGDPENKLFSLLDQIRNNPHTCGIPLIVRLAPDDIDCLRQAVESGVYDVYYGSAADASTRLTLPLKVKNAVALWRCRQALDYQSYHDKLTGLYNRRFIEEEMRRLDTGRQLPLSIISADVNGLRLTNEVFGHERGDALLAAIATILRSNCRREDLLARWGGDEFLLLLPKTSKEQAERICERIQAACRQAEQDGLKLSISLGAATKTIPETPLDQIMKAADEAMYQHKLLERRSFRNRLIQSLQQTLFEKSCETADHVERMAWLSCRIGQTLGLSRQELDAVCLLAMLHDIGKVAIPEAILSKPGPLNQAEWQEVQRHPEIGYRIVHAMPELAQIADGVLCHHEHWNGGGYPQGLEGEAIPLLARIIAVIDAYDAMTHDRPYRKRLSRREALEELQRCAGRQFDPRLVSVFAEIMQTETMACERGKKGDSADNTI